MDHRDHYNIIKTFREIFKRLPAKRKKQFWILLSGMIVAGGFETVTLGIIALFVTSVANPAAVLHSSYIKILQGVIPFAILDNLKGLILLLSAVVVIMVICKNIIAAFINYASRRYSAYAASYLGEQVLSGF
jgi:ABC-type multidrug transport system fused ATPase/permease subunit